MSTTVSPQQIDQLLMALSQQRGLGKTLCPSEVARAAVRSPSGEEGEWRPLMTLVRRQAVHMAKQGQIAIFRKGKIVEDPEGVKGVIRIGLRPPSQES